MMTHKVSNAASTPVYRFSGLVALAASGVVLSTASGFGSTSAVSPLGIWLDHTRRGAVEIYNCGPSLCGRIVWMKKPIKASGQPLRDLRNPDARKRKRTICGLKVLGKLRKTGRKTWDGGWIYDPERGKSFALQVKMQSANRLKITGYLMSPAFGKSFGWVRAPEDIGRCAPQVEAALKN